MLARLSPAGAPGSGRAWRWQGPNRVVSPSGRSFDVRLHAGFRLRPVAVKKEKNNQP